MCVCVCVSVSVSVSVCVCVCVPVNKSGGSESYLKIQCIRLAAFCSISCIGHSQPQTGTTEGFSALETHLFIHLLIDFICSQLACCHSFGPLALTVMSDVLRHLHQTHYQQQLLRPASFSWIFWDFQGLEKGAFQTPGLSGSTLESCMNPVPPARTHTHTHTQRKEISRP